MLVFPLKKKKMMMKKNSTVVQVFEMKSRHYSVFLRTFIRVYSLSNMISLSPVMINHHIHEDRRVSIEMNSDISQIRYWQKKTVRELFFCKHNLSFFSVFLSSISTFVSMFCVFRHDRFHVFFLLHIFGNTLFCLLVLQWIERYKNKQTNKIKIERNELENVAITRDVEICCDNRFE